MIGRIGRQAEAIDLTARFGGARGIDLHPGRALLQRRTIQYVEISVVLRGSFRLQIGQKLRV